MSGLTALLAGLVATVALVVAIAEPLSAFASGSQAVAAGECHRLRDAIARDGQVDAQTRARVAQGSDNDCAMDYTLRPGRPFAADDLPPGETWCHGFYHEEDMTFGGWLRVAAAHVNVGMCGNGSRARVDWGPDCPVDTLPGFTSSHDWCGVYHAGQQDQW